jgi:hypothetical protein
MKIGFYKFFYFIYIVEGGIMKGDEILRVSVKNFLYGAINIFY